LKIKIFLASLTMLMACSTEGVTESTVIEPGGDDAGSGDTDPVPTETTLEVIAANAISSALASASMRTGPHPETPSGIPHQQHNQNAPLDMQEILKAAMDDLEGVYLEATPYSFAGSMGWRLEETYAQGSAGAFIRESREFGHQHVPEDGSMHMLLPNSASKIALDKGWGVIHPLTESISDESSQYVMIYGPRDKDELQTVWIIAQISYYQARGIDMAGSYGGSTGY
jgi:phospholipase/carboxylesterase